MWLIRRIPRTSQLAFITNEGTGCPKSPSLMLYIWRYQNSIAMKEVINGIKFGIKKNVEGLLYPDILPLLLCYFRIFRYKAAIKEGAWLLGHPVQYKWCCMCTNKLIILVVFRCNACNTSDEILIRWSATALQSNQRKINVFVCARIN